MPYLPTSYCIPYLPTSHTLPFHFPYFYLLTSYTLPSHFLYPTVPLPIPHLPTSHTLENTFFSVTLYNFQNIGGLPPPPTTPPLRGLFTQSLVKVLNHVSLPLHHLIINQKYPLRSTSSCSRQLSDLLIKQ